METNEIIPWHFPMLPTENRSEDAPEDGRSSLGGCAVTTSASVVNDSNGPPLCAGCHLRIVDKFFLSALNLKWHTSCLKCSECGMELESQISCYERDGLILCKQDYHRWGFFQVLHRTHSVWKSLKMSHSNLCPIKSDLSGTTVWPQTSGFQKLAKIDPFLALFMLNETFSVILKHRA